MEIVFISGWATNSSIWNKVKLVPYQAITVGSCLLSSPSSALLIHLHSSAMCNHQCLEEKQDCYTLTRHLLSDRVLKQSLPVKYLEWNDVLKGNYTLPTECILVGWSLGGQLALNMLHHTEVKGILLVSSMCNITSDKNRPGVSSDLYKQIIAMLNRSRSGYLNSFFKQCGANDAELNELMKQAESYTNSELLEGLNMMFKEEVTPARALPASIIHATDDKVIPYECSEYIFEKFLYQCTSIFPVNGGNHLIPMTHPERIVEAVNELVERISS